ncbi:MAG: wax ester/triacylglycerol synthase family O-acyltransferase [Cellvibrionaceae bacterium]|nr:wax ester/triacylglycerol synthase family O-acyltransferase [Cellvibrionaceae bacterium]
MQHLSGTDNMFLEMEDNRQHMHIASLGIYDQSTAPGGEVRFKTILEFFSKKINEMPLFRRRLVQAPLGLDRPYWVDDGEIDVEYHVRHIALPDPGDWRQLMIQIARIHARPLDTSRPLWEAYIIGGLDNIEGIKKGSFALYLKVHHATMDGQAGAKMIQVMHELSPDYKPGRGTSVIYADREPNKLELLARAVGNRSKQVVGAAKFGLELYGKGIKLGLKYGPDIIEKGEFDLKRSVKGLRRTLAGPKHRNRFDAKVSPHRVIDAFGISLDDCKVIRQHLPCTINDIFMATVAGGLHNYLKSHGELPEDTMNALMPLAASGDQVREDSGNNISMAPVSIYTNIEDPIERIKAIHESSGNIKDLQDELGRDFLSKLNDALPVFLSKRINQLAMQNQASLVVSNVRGPNFPLYLAGARLQMFIPASIPFDFAGLNITGFSYDHVLWVCSTACREMVPDPDHFSQCMKDAFAEILEAAKKQPLLADKAKEKASAKTAAKSAAKSADKPAKKAAPKKASRAKPKTEAKPKAASTKKRAASKAKASTTKAKPATTKAKPAAAKAKPATAKVKPTTAKPKAAAKPAEPAAQEKQLELGGSISAGTTH